MSLVPKEGRPVPSVALPADAVQAAQNARPRPAAAPPAWVRHLQLAAVAAILIGYAGMSHYSASNPNAKGLGAILSIAPVALIGLILVWRWTRPLLALVIATLLCAGLYHYWGVVKDNFEWADLVQQCGAYALLAISFLRTLFANRIPLCTRMADKLHGPLTPLEITYTRRATEAWAVFYALIALAILVLFFSVSIRIWSLFVNFAVFGLIMLMAIADHAIRHRLLPHHRRGALLAAIKRALIG